MRIIETIKNKTGKHIDSQKEMGGWPSLKSTRPAQDCDNDGMPDTWEKQHDLNIKLADNNSDSDKDGYTNIEEFLNNTDPNSK